MVCSYEYDMCSVHTAKLHCVLLFAFMDMPKYKQYLYE